MIKFIIRLLYGKPVEGDDAAPKGIGKTIRSRDFESRFPVNDVVLSEDHFLYTPNIEIVD